MIFGRKNRGKDEADEAIEDAELTRDEDVDDFEDEDDADDADVADDTDDVDYRYDGPFDIDEVDLDGDEVERIRFGALTVTPFPGLNIQLNGDEATSTIYTMMNLWDNSGLELALFAAPSTGSLAEEMREDIIEEAEQAGGSAEIADGPFGPEVRRVLPLEGPEGEQLFHVSRIWLVDGPRWLLRGTLMGPAAMSEGEDAPADTFVELFRNTIVHRDDEPRVPGELITLALPSDDAQG